MKQKITYLPERNHNVMMRYLSGFILSVALTIGAFLLVYAYRSSDGELFARGVLFGVVGIFAVMQVAVQAVYFLHLSSDERTKWTRYAVIFAVAVALIIIVGSLWIMQNLNYNMMPEHTTKYMSQEEGITRP